MANYKTREDIVLADVILLFHKGDESHALEIEDYLKSIEFPTIGKVRVVMVEQDTLPKHLEDVKQAVDRGVVLLTLFTSNFSAGNLASNAVYQVHYYTIKQNTDSFVPVYLENPRRAKFVPRAFCTLRGIWWSKPGNELALHKLLEHHITEKYPFSDK